VGELNIGRQPRQFLHLSNQPAEVVVGVSVIR
jgi:hypothetical protein